MTPDRIVHAVVALVFVGLYCWVRPPKRPVTEFSLLAGMAIIGSWVPDWDLFLGIGFHRSPLTHSMLPAVILALAVRKLKWTSVSIGFSLGIASHLVWDTLDYGNVVGIPGGDADRLFLLVNAAVLMVGCLWASQLWPGIEKKTDELKESEVIPQTFVEEAMKNAVDEVIEERRQKLSNSRPISVNRMSNVTIVVCSILLIGYFVAAAIANS